MLTIYDPSNPTNGIPFPIEDDKRYVTHAYNGLDTLTFEIQSDNPLYKYIAEEGKVEDEKNRFVIKCIDEHSDFVTVVCDIDLDDWKRDIIYSFRTTNKLLVDVLSMILPEGWRMMGAEAFSKRTTVEGVQGSPMCAVTPLEVLIEAADAYSCVFNFDVINKTVTVIDPKSFKPSGQFFTDELNLKSLGFVGSSDGFATRLYAYGKKDADGNPLTVASVNDGKPYVEDYSYSNKVVSVGWSDERYTNPESLLEAAKLKLEQISHPIRSYECDAKNLDEDVWLYKVVTLIDRRRNTRVNHQIVEFREYPDHTLDVITLSKTAPNLKAFVSQVQSDTQEALDQEASKSKSALEEAIKHATSQITGNNGGAFVWIFDAEGKPVELLNLCDSTDLNKAKSVWRWNASGLGHSNTGYNGAMTLALLPNGSINASAITTGVLNAELVKVINLLAERLRSQTATSQLDIDGASLRLSANGKETFSVDNYSDDPEIGSEARCYFREYDETGAEIARAQLGARQLSLGGTWVDPIILFTVVNNRPRMYLDGMDGPLYISFKNNGDGTYTLIGKEK